MMQNHLFFWLQQPSFRNLALLSPSLGFLNCMFPEPVTQKYSPPPVQSLFAAISDTPSTHDALCLLKLWRAVSCLKHRVASSNPTVWPSFVVYALHRFALFASAFASMPEFNPNLHVLPPLDVAWVWHSLLTAPEACYAMFAESAFANFLQVPFPLRQLGDAISSSFDYTPDQLARHNFDALLANFGKGYYLEYENVTFDPSSIVLPVYCPISKALLVSVPLSHFACSSFSVRSKEGVISHHSLARRQSDAALTQSALRPSRSLPLEEWPSFGSPGSPSTDSSSPPSPINSNSSCACSSSTPTSWTSQKSFSFESANPLVHLTIEEDCLQISGDWIDHLVLSPVQNIIDSGNWLSHPKLSVMLTSAVMRYKSFWKLLSKNSTGPALVPTLDIRLVWYTHMARFNEYADFSVFHTDVIMVPPVSGSQTTKDLEKTATLYQKRFHAPYLHCGHTKNSPPFSRKTCTLSCYKNIYELLAPSGDQQ
ncbi:hypothetical protein CJJ07_000923 [Candidozyma auris]|nr:hypothetical protein CJJ07_000923 [[Candida] auris]